MQFLEGLCKQGASVWAIVVDLLGVCAWLNMEPLNMIVVFILLISAIMIVTHPEWNRLVVKWVLFLDVLFIVLCIFLNWCYNQEQKAAKELAGESVAVILDAGEKVTEAFSEMKIPKLKLTAVVHKGSDEGEQGSGNDNAREGNYELEDGGVVKSEYERIEFIATLMNVDKLPDDAKIRFRMCHDPDDDLVVTLLAYVWGDGSGHDGTIASDSLSFRLEEPVALYYTDSNAMDLNYLYDTYLQEQINEGLSGGFTGYSAAGSYIGADFTNITCSLRDYSLSGDTANIRLPLSIETEDERIDMMLKAQASPLRLDACLVGVSFLPAYSDVVDEQAEELERKLLEEAQEALLFGASWLGKVTALTSVEPETPYYLVSHLTLPDYVDLEEIDDWTVTLSWYWRDRAAGLLEGRAMLFHGDRLYDFAVWDVMVQSEVVLADDYPDMVEISTWADTQDSTLACLSKNFDGENLDDLLFYRRVDGRFALLTSVLEPLEGVELENREIYVVMRLAWHEEADQGNFGGSSY